MFIHGLITLMIEKQHSQSSVDQCPPVAVAVAKQKGTPRSGGYGAATSNKLEFNIVELSDSMGWDSGPVKRELKLLEWTSGKLLCSYENTSY